MRVRFQLIWEKLLFLIGSLTLVAKPHIFVAILSLEKIGSRV